MHVKADNPKTDERKQQIGSVVKALRILECFDGSHQELSLKQIAEQLGCPKTTAFSLIHTLRSAGYLEQSEETQVFRLGTKLLDLGYNTKSALSVIHLCTPFLDRLRIQTQQNVYLTTHREGRLLFLESCYRDREYISYSATGKTLPLHCTASGKAMMSYMTAEQVEAIVRKHGLERTTSNTITDLSMLNQELADTRSRGFAVDYEEETLGVKCVAVAILNQRSVPVGAISISGSAISMTLEKVYEYADCISRHCRSVNPYADLFPFRFIKEEVG